METLTIFRNLKWRLNITQTFVKGTVDEDIYIEQTGGLRCLIATQNLQDKQKHLRTETGGAEMEPIVETKDYVL